MIPSNVTLTKEMSDIISFYENFHNINKMNAIFIFFSLSRVEFFFPPVSLFPTRLELCRIFM